MQEDETERRRRFDALFTTYSSDIVAYCGWRSASATDAQDAVAEVFMTAWRRLDELPTGDAARVWLYASARRVMANQRRSSRRRAALHDRLTLEATPTPSTDALTDGEEALVHEALRCLAPHYREVLLLAEWDGLSPAEIAGVMGCVTVTARGRLHRARRRFRIAFEELLARDATHPSRHEASVDTNDSYTLRSLAAARPRRATQVLAKEEHGHV